MTKIALTFDDGPGPDSRELVNYLIAQRAAATFFLQGNQCELRPEVVRLMASTPLLELATHTHTHPDLTITETDCIKSEVEGGIAALQTLTARRPTLFRPPRGHRDDRVDAAARELGQAVILWTLNSFDYKPEFASAGHILKSARSGDIILLHDTHSGIVDLVRQIVPELRRRGFEFVTVSDLLGPCTAGRVYHGRNSVMVRLTRWAVLQQRRAHYRWGRIRSRR